MTKALEALKRIRQETCPATYMADFDKNECCDVIEQALHRLEAIDNANPSEALECLDRIDKTMRYADYDDDGYKYIEPCKMIDICDEEFDKVKQALLKAQELKHYLKWEDLEFGKTTHKLKARMNDSLYRIEWYIDGLGSKVVCIEKYITNDYLIHSACIKDYNQQFFNDLHLERVEE